MSWLDDWRRHHAHPSAVSCEPEDVALALHGALLNEAIILIEEGAVRRASDIDVIGVAALQMERSTGGPLFLSDLNGLLPVILAMQQWEKIVRPLWAPHQSLMNMVKNGKSFY
jgi:3-hydroxyacyl-CoA dehydrogenase